MNDFHILSICIQNKDVAGAMRVLRDKSEFAVRKILEKLRVRVTTQTGRAFWHYVQGWLLTACRQGNIQHESFITRRSSHYPERQPAQSRCTRYGQTSCTSGHDYRPHQYGVSVVSLAGDVCAWPDGLPLFTLIWAMNVQRTPERLQKRANRLWIWAVITQPVFSLAFQNQQPWWALNILFVFAGVTQLLALQYRHGRKGMLAGYLLLALMIWPLQPASYGLAGITLAISMATVSGRDTPGVQRLAAITAVLSLICLNGLSHLLDMPAETLLLATLPTLAFPLAVVSFCRQICPEGRRRFMPRNFFYYAYAGHLGIIGLVQTTFG